MNDSYRMDGYNDPHPVNAGANPPMGAVFNYWLKDATDTSSVSITVFDKNNKVIKHFQKMQKIRAISSHLQKA